MVGNQFHGFHSNQLEHEACGIPGHLKHQGQELNTMVVNTQR